MSDEQLLTENVETVESTEAVESVEQTAPVEVSAAATNEWYSEDYADLIESKGFKTADDVLKSYKNLEAMTGNSVRIPSEDASPEAKADFYEKIKDLDGVLIKDSDDFYNKLGRPEDATGYDFGEVIDGEMYGSVPNLDAELTDFQHIAHEAGLTNEQAAKLVEMRMSTIEAQQEALEAQKAASEQSLKKHWGADYDNRLASARQVVKIYGEKYGDTINQLVNSAAGNNPALLDMLSELGSMYKEKNHEGMQSNQFGMTPEMAQAKIAEMRADRGFLAAYQDDMHPGHREAVSKLQKLYQLANGS